MFGWPRTISEDLRHETPEERAIRQRREAVAAELARRADRIDRYVLTVRAGVRAQCPTCGTDRPVWKAITVGGDTITACGTCQRTLRRERG